MKGRILAKEEGEVVVREGGSPAAEEGGVAAAAAVVGGTEGQGRELNYGHSEGNYQVALLPHPIISVPLSAKLST